MHVLPFEWHQMIKLISFCIYMCKEAVEPQVFICIFVCCGGIFLFRYVMSAFHDSVLIQMFKYKNTLTVLIFLRSVPNYETCIFVKNLHVQMGCLLETSINLILQLHSWFFQFFPSSLTPSLTLILRMKTIILSIPIEVATNLAVLTIKTRP